MKKEGKMNVIITVVVLVAIFIYMAVKIVPEYQRIVVLRLGRVIGAKGPGLILLIPYVDRPLWADLREIFIDIPQQTCITKDNAGIGIDFLIYMKIVEPIASVINVQNFLGAAEGIAKTTLRAVVGDIPLDDVLAKREQINLTLRAKLDEVTERWGVKITSVEIREILPPKDIQEAMTRQMSAERSRRAVVTEAEGKREAAITVAQGEKQAAILKAEGQRQALILTAEGDRQARILNAEGYAEALHKIFDIAKTIDHKTLNLQYLEALKTIGSQASTKFIIPMEFTNLLKPFVETAQKSTKE